MNKGLEAINDIKWYHMDTNGTVERCEIIEKELKKPQQLYDLIKQKRDNAQNDFNCFTHKLEETKDMVKCVVFQHNKIILMAEITTYNDILSLIESMFEVKR